MTFLKNFCSLSIPSVYQIEEKIFSQYPEIKYRYPTNVFLTLRDDFVDCEKKNQFDSQTIVNNWIEFVEFMIDLFSFKN